MIIRATAPAALSVVLGKVWLLNKGERAVNKAG